MKTACVKKLVLRYITLLLLSILFNGKAISQVKTRIHLQDDTMNVRNHLLWKENDSFQQTKKNRVYKREEADLNKSGHPVLSRNDTLNPATNHVSSGKKPSVMRANQIASYNKANAGIAIHKGELKQQKESHPQNHLLWREDTVAIKH